MCLYAWRRSHATQYPECCHLTAIAVTDYVFRDASGQPVNARDRGRYRVLVSDLTRFKLWYVDLLFDRANDNQPPASASDREAYGRASASCASDGEIFKFLPALHCGYEPLWPQSSS